MNSVLSVVNLETRSNPDAEEIRGTAMESGQLINPTGVRLSGPLSELSQGEVIDETLPQLTLRRRGDDLSRLPLWDGAREGFGGGGCGGGDDF